MITIRHANNKIQYDTIQITYVPNVVILYSSINIKAIRSNKYNTVVKTIYIFRDSVGFAWTFHLPSHCHACVCVASVIL